MGFEVNPVPGIMVLSAMGIIVIALSLVLILTKNKQFWENRKKIRIALIALTVVLFIATVVLAIIFGIKIDEGYKRINRK